jgi:hypothetical protein
MSWQIWDPPAIIIPAPPKAEIRASIQKENISPEELYKAIYDTPWNKIQADGRINIDGESSASVSPYSKHFRSQVEDGIWPLVELLCRKGYLPVSSCAGHRNNILKELETFFEYHSSPYVTVAVNREVEKLVVESFEELAFPYVAITVKHSQANMDGSLAAKGKIKKAKRKNIQNEYQSLNWMMKRNYSEWSYVSIHINPWKRFSFSHVLRTQKEKALIQKLSQSYEDLPDYIF